MNFNVRCPPCIVFSNSLLFILRLSLAFLTVYVERNFRQQLNIETSLCYDTHDTVIYVPDEMHDNTWITDHGRLI